MYADYVWCQNCQTAIAPDELRKIYESWGESYYLCPYCGSDALVDAEECTECGELFDGTKSEDSICPECMCYLEKRKGATEE